MAAGPNGQLYLFGGNDEQVYFNDLWRYENGEWMEIEVDGPRPSARTLAAITYVPFYVAGGTQGGLLLFGGITATGDLPAGLWLFDPVAGTWQELDGGSSSGTGQGGRPPGRMAHSLTYDVATGQVVLVGGVTDEGDAVLNDTWHYTPNGWTKMALGPAPARPAYHQAIYVNNSIILFSNGEVWKYE
jgi:hypothetical protein